MDRHQQLAEYLLSIIDKGATVVKSKWMQNGYDITRKDGTKLHIMQGWDLDRFNFFMRAVDSHSRNGKWIGKEIIQLTKEQ